MAKIYLACPYSHEMQAVLERRFKQVSYVAGQIMKLGHVVFSPISHSHPIAEQIGQHLNHKFWLKQDYEFIDWCDELWILCLDGWGESAGIKREIEYASTLEVKAFPISKPIKFVYYDDFVKEDGCLNIAEPASTTMRNLVPVKFVRDDTI